MCRVQLWALVAVLLSLSGCQTKPPPSDGQPYPRTPSPGEKIAVECRFVPPTAAETARQFPAQKQYRFTSDDVFSSHIPIWEENLGSLRNKPNLHYLEIGVFEGRSAIWMLTNLLTHPTAKMTVIDPFPDGRGDTWQYNLAQSGSADKVTTITGYSQTELRKLPLESFDIVYIDGSHVADDVLADVVLCWDLLKPGGIVVFDDYLLRYATRYSEELRPRVAIDSFITAYRHTVEVLHRCYQVIIKKRANPCPKFAHSPIGKYCYSWRQRQLFTATEKKVVPLNSNEADLIEEMIKSRNFGEVSFSPDKLLTDNPQFSELAAGLELQSLMIH